MRQLAGFTGRYVIKWYLSFFKDQSALNYYNLYLYGGFFETFAQLTAHIGARILPIDVYEARHLINALFGLLAIFYTYKLAAHLSGPSAGFFSALFLTFTPGFLRPHIQQFERRSICGPVFQLPSTAYFGTYKELPRVSIRTDCGAGCRYRVGSRNTDWRNDPFRIPDDILVVLVDFTMGEREDSAGMNF